jgi:hypothetical protein
VSLTGTFFISARAIIKGVDEEGDLLRHIATPDAGATIWPVEPDLIPPCMNLECRADQALDGKSYRAVPAIPAAARVNVILRYIDSHHNTDPP